MASITLVGTGQGDSVSSIAINPTQTLFVNDFLVVIASDRNEGITSVADNSSQSGSANSYGLDMQQVAGANVEVDIYSCRVTRQILTSDAITVTWTAGNGRKYVDVFLLSPIVTSSPVDVTAGGSQLNSGSWSSGSVASSTADLILIGATGTAPSNNSTTDDLPDSPWVEQHDVTGDKVFVVGSRVVSSTGTYGYTGSFGVTMTNNIAAAMVGYKLDTAAPGPAPTYRVTSSGLRWRI